MLPKDKQKSKQRDDKKNAINKVAADPASTLLKIVHGDVDDLKVPHKSIITGKKFKNSILEKFIREFQKNNKITDTRLIEVILVLDKAIESEHLTEETLEYLRDNPGFMKNMK